MTASRPDILDKINRNRSLRNQQRFENALGVVVFIMLFAFITTCYRDRKACESRGGVLVLKATPMFACVQEK